MYVLRMHEPELDLKAEYDYVMQCIMIETAACITQLGITAPEFPGPIWLACGGGQGTKGTPIVCVGHAGSVL